METFTKQVANSCGISEREAEQEINETAKYLQDLAANDDLRYSDVEDAMLDLGMECDDPDIIFSLLLR